MNTSEKLSHATSAMETLAPTLHTLYENSAVYTIGTQNIHLCVNSYLAENHLTVAVGPNTKRPDINALYIDDKAYTRIRVKISINKTVEQIRKEITRRVLNAPEFALNEQYLLEKLNNQTASNLALEANKAIFSEYLAFNRGDDNTEASIFNDRKGTTNYLRVNVKASSSLHYCTMELKGLTADEWKRILDVVNPIIKSTIEVGEE